MISNFNFSETQFLAMCREYLQQYVEELVEDGILYKGPTKLTPEGIRYREQSKDNSEYTIWSSSKLRLCFVTKDQNSQGDPWDSRGEFPNVRYAFNRNLLSFTWAILNTTGTFIPSYDFSWDDAQQLLLRSAVAHIHAVKRPGNASISNAALRKYLQRDSALLLEQLNGLNPNVLVCCGYSESIEESGNLILNTLNQAYSFQQVNDWIWYSQEKKIIAINSYHLSVRMKGETLFNGLCDALNDFIAKYPDFLK